MTFKRGSACHEFSSDIKEKDLPFSLHDLTPYFTSIIFKYNKESINKEHKKKQSLFAISSLFLISNYHFVGDVVKLL